MALALLILVGCAKEETTTAALSTADQQVEETSGSAYLFNFTGENPVLEIISEDELQSNSSSNATTRSNSVHAHGDFHGYGPEGEISFSGTQNNGGAHGSAEVQITFGPFGTAHVIMETVSLISDGEDKVVYGGVITEIIENTVNFPSPPGCPGAPYCPQCDPYDLGTYVYFCVKDNGQGNNAPLDQYVPGIFNTCSEVGSGGSSLLNYPLINVGQESDQIKVND